MGGKIHMEGRSQIWKVSWQDGHCFHAWVSMKFRGIQEWAEDPLGDAGSNEM